MVRVALSRQQVVKRLGYAKPLIKAVCHDCKSTVGQNDIEGGWTEEVGDITTACPQCGRRITAKLLLLSTSSWDVIGAVKYISQFQLFCAFERLLTEHKRQLLGQTFLYNSDPDLLWNMIVHFGKYDAGLRAFRKWQASR